MNVNLDKRQIRELKHGETLYQTFKFEVRWYDPATLNQPYDVDSKEVKTARKAIERGEKVPAPIFLNGYGIVKGLHVLEAFKALEYRRVPVLWGNIRDEYRKD